MPEEKWQKHIQNTKYKKTKDCVTPNQLKPEMNLGAPEGWKCPVPLVPPVVLFLLQIQ